MPIPWAALLGGTLLGGALARPRRWEPDIATIPTTTPEQRRIAASLADLIGTNLGRPLPTYPGPLAAELSPLESQAMATLSAALRQQAQQSYAGALSAALQALPPAAQYQPPQAPEALSRILAGQPTFTVTPEESARLFEETVAAPAVREFETRILPAIREQFVGTGALYSSMRAQAEAEAARDLAAALAEQRARWAREDIAAQRQALEAAAQRAAGVTPAALSFALEAARQPIEIGLAQRQQLANELFRSAEQRLAEQQAFLDTARLAAGMGAQAREAEQQQIAARLQEWLRTRPETSPYMQMALSFLGIPFLAAYQPVYPPSPWAQLVGLAGQLGAGWLAGGMPSWARILAGLGV